MSGTDDGDSVCECQGSVAHSIFVTNHVRIMHMIRRKTFCVYDLFVQYCMTNFIRRSTFSRNPTSHASRMSAEDRSDASTSGCFTVACLHRILSRSTGARGLPPKSLLSRGVALVSVTDAARLTLHVTQQICVAHTNCAAIVSVWPSSRVEPGYVALDDATLHSLDIPSTAPVARMTPATPRNTPIKSSTKKSSAKKSSSKKKRAQNVVAPAQH